MSDRINCRNCIHFNDLEHRCCLNDGNEIKKECYFTLSNRNPKGKDVVIENLKTKVADLEAKLAESENCACKHIGELTKIATEKDRKIEELKQQLAEMTEKYNACQEARKLEAEFSQQDKKELIQQLAEKDLRIEELESQFKHMCKGVRRYDFGELLIENTQLKVEHNQDKISFAVEQLEKVKNKFNGKRPIDDLANEVGLELGYTATQIQKYIDNQIEELKRENANDKEKS